MKYCSECGSRVSWKVPAGDNRERYICVKCGIIHYQNPKVVVGCIPEWESKVLLCQRSIEPGKGMWTLPAGFMENDETSQDGACREAMEEAHAILNDIKLFSVFNIPHINQVYIMFRAELNNGEAKPGVESKEVTLVDEKDIPWDDLAFPVIKETLRLYLNDRAQGEFKIHFGDIIKENEKNYSVKYINK